LGDFLRFAVARDAASFGNPTFDAPRSAKEFADRRRDLWGMRLQREMTGVEEAYGAPEMSRLNAPAPGGRKKGTFLPHTARNRGLWVRKYFWKVG